MNHLKVLAKVMRHTGWLSNEEIRQVWRMSRRGLKVREIATWLRPRKL